MNSTSETSNIHNQQAGLRETIKGLLGAGDASAAAALLDIYLAKHPDDALMQYNAACVNARLGDLERAERHLRSAVKFGFHQFSVMKRDSDLAPLRPRTVYQSIMAARDAADNVIADRRNNHWLGQLGDSYHLSRDVERRIDVICAADDEATAGIMARIAEVADVESQFLNIALPNRITIVVLDPPSAQRIFGSPNIRGNYRHEMREMVITNIDRSLQHELMHAYHHAHMDAVGQDHPVWIQEGLASLFESYRVEDDGGAITFLPNDRQVAMKYILETNDGREAPPAARRFMRSTEEAFKRDAPTTYPMARSFMEYIDAIGDVRSWYHSYVEHYSIESTGEAALVFALNAPLQQIESNWRVWVVTRDEAIEPLNRSENQDIRVAAAMPQPLKPTKPADIAHVAGNSDSAGATIVVDERQMRASAMYQSIRPLILEGRYEQAMPELVKLLEQFPDHGDARYDLALGYIKRGDRDAARAEYERLKQTHANLAAMVLACLERSVIVKPRPVVVVKPTVDDMEKSEAASTAEPLRKPSAIMTHPAPPIPCNEMNY